ncbi:MAG: dTDP-glucose pyrophosphorylase [Thermoplasmatales archaeon]|nr:dTDP-glucose pyrophosphorylase [Thermoplasmatales archaeon]
MKAVITAAGSGIRSGLDGKLRKEMLPIYDIRERRIVLRPIIDCIITRLTHLGINEIAVITDPQDDSTNNYLKKNFSSVSILSQERKLGFGNAVLMASEFIGNDEFILNAGDGILLDDQMMQNSLSSEHSGITLYLMKVDHPERYGVAEIYKKGGKNYVSSVVEKPKAPKSNLALCAVYKLNGKIFDYLKRDHSENVELTPSINILAQKAKIEGLVVPKSYWQSVGRAEDYIKVLRATLAYSRKLTD